MMPVQRQRSAPFMANFKLLANLRFFTVNQIIGNTDDEEEEITITATDELYPEKTLKKSMMLRKK